MTGTNHLVSFHDEVGIPSWSPRALSSTLNNYIVLCLFEINYLGSQQDTLHNGLHHCAVYTCFLQSAGHCKGNQAGTETAALDPQWTQPDEPAVLSYEQWLLPPADPIEIAGNGLPNIESIPAHVLLGVEDTRGLDCHTG